MACASSLYRFEASCNQIYRGLKTLTETLQIYTSVQSRPWPHGATWDPGPWRHPGTLAHGATLGYFPIHRYCPTQGIVPPQDIAMDSNLDCIARPRVSSHPWVSSRRWDDMRDGPRGHGRGRGDFTLFGGHGNDAMRYSPRSRDDQIFGPWMRLDIVRNLAL